MALAEKFDSMPLGRLLPSQPALVLIAAALSFLAASIHLSEAPHHFEEWWGYGTFFLIMATMQGLYSAALLRWAHRPLLLPGIAVNLGSLALYIVTRTAGVPFFGPHAWVVEPIGAVDIVCKSAEIALILTLIILARASQWTGAPALPAAG